MQPIDAFARLRNTGAFVENRDGVHIHWYWHIVGNGFKIMACRNLDSNTTPTFYREFHVSDRSLQPKLYF